MEHRGFQGSEATLDEIIMVGTCFSTVVQTHKMYNTQSELQCKLWTWGDHDVPV